MHMGNFWMVYWSTPNHPMEVIDIKGTYNHHFMIQSDSVLDSYEEQEF